MKINKALSVTKRTDYIELKVTNTETKEYFSVTNNDETVIIRLSLNSLNKINKKLKAKGERK